LGCEGGIPNILGGGNGCWDFGRVQKEVERVGRGRGFAGERLRQDGLGRCEEVERGLGDESERRGKGDREGEP
jgi:hypothetical protein